MRKEVILAVIIGIILGGVILYGINLANNSATKNSTEKQTTQEENLSSSSSQTGNLEITFVAPQDHAVITEDKTTLKGSTKPNSNIAIITELDDILTLADANGNFSSPINLDTGENTITVTVVDDKQATFSSSITLIHTSSIPE